MMNLGERVSRYIEVLKKLGRSNNSKNWKRLNELSDEDLMNDKKVEEHMRKFDEYEEYLKNHPNKYPEDIMKDLRQWLSLDEYDNSKDDIINEMSPKEVFSAVCEWEGFIGYSDKILSWIESIFNVDLDG